MKLINRMHICKRILLAAWCTVSVISAKVPGIQSDIFYEVRKGNTKAVKAWIKTKPDLNIKNEKGQSILTVAVLQEHYNLVKILLKAGVPVNSLDLSDKTALDYAVESGHDQMVLKLARYKACASTQQNAEIVTNIIQKKYKRICTIWGAITAVSCCLVLIAVGLCAWDFVGWKPTPSLFLGVPGLVMGIVGFFMTAGCATSYARRKDYVQYYLSNV
jgi:hypothetical protein